MRPVTGLIHGMSWALGGAAALALLGLIGVTLVEVVSRYVFRAPTVWAFDIAYMLNGTSFLLACALALRVNQHVAVDILSQSFPPRVRRAIEIVLFAFLVFPALAFLSWASWGEFWRSWATGEVEVVSPWRPRMWPFRLVVALGLTALTLQVLARVVEPHRATEPS